MNLPSEPDHPPVHVGIIGCGRIANKAYVPAINAAPTVTLAAAASRELARAKATGATRAYDNYEALLDDDDIEAVYIATHNGLHHALTLAALARGKHVLCEKSMACNAAEARDMLNAARQHDRLAVEAFMYRYHPCILEAVRLIREGAIGELRTVEASFSFRLDDEGDVRYHADWGGGALLDVGCYCVNACRTFFGTMPHAVNAQAEFHTVHGIDLALHGLLDFGRGRHGVISSGFDAGFRNRILACGTHGTLSLPAGVRMNRVDVEMTLDTPRETRVFNYPPVDFYQLIVEDFARAVRGGRLMLDPVEPLRNALVHDALFASARSGGDRVTVASTDE